MNTLQEQEILKKAYFVLGLESGSSLEDVLRRHKQLVMVWHPDRSRAESKEDCEEELKKINDARDQLTEHFQKRHSDTNCVCTEKAESFTAKISEPTPPTPDRTDPFWEAAESLAKERREALIKTAEQEVDDEEIRWKITPYLAAAWLVLILFSWGWEHTHPYYR